MKKFHPIAFLVFFPLVLAGGAAVSARAQNAPTPPATNGADNGGRRGRGNFSPDQMMDRLREQLGVTDDAEWAIISPRIQAVQQLMFGGFGRGGGGRGAGGGLGRVGRNDPEGQALQDAIQNNMPDTEIKLRLQHLRDSRQAQAAKLTKAQDDLKAVLTIKQEAILVMYRMLP